MINKDKKIRVAKRNKLINSQDYKWFKQLNQILLTRNEPQFDREMIKLCPKTFKPQNRE